MQTNNPELGSLQSELKAELNRFLENQNSLIYPNEQLKIDLHCHDYNSDVPDELLGRILNLPETWLETDKLIETLKDNDCNAFTITNHNNARSCYELLDRGIDVLVGTEFSCTVPDYNVGIHVLTYGFNPEQEGRLNKLRKNVYGFLEYANANNIPTVWAHPLYHYNVNGALPMDFFAKMALVFERFEVLNGQRDTWQNMLVKVWIESLTADEIDRISKEIGINPSEYCINPYKKSMTGGSDDHMGIFAGRTGSHLYVPGLKERLKAEPASVLALEAIRQGNISPYGSHQNAEKLTIAFLDYMCQIALNHKDPGLMRILLHKGTTNDKLLALLVSNAFAELRRHTITMRFIKTFHDCFNGKKPNPAKSFFVPKVHKPVFYEAGQIAWYRRHPTENLAIDMSKSIDKINLQLSNTLFQRLEKKIKEIDTRKLESLDLNQFIDQLEIPSELRVLIDSSSRQPVAEKGKKKKENTKRMVVPNIPDFLDGLSFPFLASSVLLAANFTSTKVLFNSRPLLNNFAAHLGKFNHPKRMLWLTDTFEDKNGVSMVLQAMHREIKRRKLPIDIMVCSSTLQPDDNLIVVRPISEFTLPFYQEQPIRVPNFMEIHHLFYANEYDRLICSTEGIMGLMGLYLKNAYHVKGYFYVHTDWMMFARKVLNIDRNNINRSRRMLRAYYKGFDGLFVLNTDQQNWLMDREMAFPKESVFLTAHWADECFKPLQSNKTKHFGLDENTPVLLFSGRLSHEKGVMELPEMYQQVKNEIPGLQLVIAGTGPVEKKLKEAIPEAIFLGWVDHEKLPEIYSSADLLVLPSKFDTFSCSVLEAFSCGLPVLAYSSKGPKDIIQHQQNGFLVNNRPEMARAVAGYFSNPSLHKAFKDAALKRAMDYTSDKIIGKLLTDVRLVD